MGNGRSLDLAGALTFRIEKGKQIKGTVSVPPRLGIGLTRAGNLELDDLFHLIDAPLESPRQ